MRFSITSAEERRAQFDQQRNRSAGANWPRRKTQHANRLAASRSKPSQKRTEIDRNLADTEKHLERLGEQIGRLENQRMHHGRETTEIKVELAKSEERLRNLDDRLRQLEENRQERYRAIEESREQLDRKHRPGRNRAMEHLARRIGNRRTVYPQGIVRRPNGDS